MMEDMPERYSDHHCHDCGEDLFQLSGNWYCPECDDVSEFKLDSQQSEFVV